MDRKRTSRSVAIRRLFAVTDRRRLIDARR
jgi:hypothetical protein